MSTSVLKPMRLLVPGLLAASAIRANSSSAQSPRAKEDTTPVTQADIAAHNAVAEWVNMFGDGIPLLSEESAHPAWAERRTWSELYLLDPLDGTTEFVRGSSEYGVSLAFIKNSLVHSGVIVAPATGEIAWGVVGSGAFCVQMKPEDLDSLDEVSATALAEKITSIAKVLHTQPNPVSFTDGSLLRVLCSRSHTDPETSAHLDSLGDAKRITVGACLKFVRLAQGVANYYPRLRKLHEWDIAAGHAIVKAAGGNVYLFGTKEEIRYNGEDLSTPYFEAY